MAKSVALIFHKHERNRNIPSFAIWHLTEIWRKEGIKVHLLFGTEKYVPADVSILHVDLSVVPEEYIDFASRYPAALNGNLRDIRKSVISRNKVGHEDVDAGRVIVKSDLNYAGQPERKLLGNPFSRLAFRIACRVPLLQTVTAAPGEYFQSPTDYKIYDNSHSVPRDWFDRGDLVVEKFVPEIKEDLYCLRIYHFLGDRGVCILWQSGQPIIKSTTDILKREVIEVHPEILKLTKSLRFDYGKFDYVLREGKPVLLDANKTPGAGKRAGFLAMCSEWASGIHAYL